MSNYINIDISSEILIGSGVYNCGSSCFFNSVNQMIFHIPEIREFLIRHKFLFEGNSIILNLINLMEKMKLNSIFNDNGNLINNNPIEIKEPLFDKSIQQFYLNIQLTYYRNRGDRQEDAPTLYQHYFSNFNSSINKSINSKVGIYKSDINEYFNIYSKINFPISYTYFYQIEQKKCIYNDNIINDIVTYNDIYTHNFNSDKMLNLNPIDDIISDYNECYPPGGINTTKITNIVPNKYLLMKVGKESYTFESGNFISTMTYEDITNPNFPNIEITDNSGNKYEMIGTICKSGSVGGGHYWYYHKINNIWYEFNDSTVSIEEPSNENMILCLFRRIGADYKINIYKDINDIELNLLNYLKTYKNTTLVSNEDKIKEYINIMKNISYKYNNNLNIIYNQLYIEVINNLKRNIADLLT